MGARLILPSPISSDWGKTGENGDSLLFLLSLLRRVPPPSLFRQRDPKTWGESLDPSTGGAGSKGGISPGRCTDVSGGVCVRALKGVGGFPLAPALGRKRKADFL